jgi:hypothetical protein
MRPGFAFGPLPWPSGSHCGFSTAGSLVVGADLMMPQPAKPAPVNATAKPCKIAVGSFMLKNLVPSGCLIGNATRLIDDSQVRAD